MLRARILLLLSILLVSGCLTPPYAPNASILKSTAELSDGVSLHFMNHDVIPATNRNLIFIAADDQSEQAFGGFLKEAYPLRAAPRLEEAAWWEYSGDIQKLYDRVLRIRYDRFDVATLNYALQYMEYLGKPYDLMLLTHGVPNNIVSSVGSPLVSWKDVDALKDKVSGLRMVFMQGCWSESLVADWKANGAKAVLSYPGLNRNFFFYGFFLKHLEETPEDIQTAYNRTLTTVASDIATSPLYVEMIEKGLGVSLEDYLQQSPNPDLN